MINSFRGDFYFLSNFYLSLVFLDDIFYRSVEHAYQAAKTLDHNQRKLICQQPTARDAKRSGRIVTLRHDWEGVKLDIMGFLVRQKFTNIVLRKKLINTYPKILIEENTWGDTFWGVFKGKGENHLGKILMEVREELRK